MKSCPHSLRGERGSVLLALLFTGIGLAWIVSGLVASTRELALEYRAHREVVCARYAALSGLALAEPSSAHARPRYSLGKSTGAGEAVLAVTLSGSGSGDCLLQSEGRCGSARYPITRRVDAGRWCR